MYRWLMLSLGVLMTSMLAYSAAPTKSATKERAGKAFFESRVVPQLVENGCPMCHAVGYVQPNVVVYEQILPYLAMGDAPAKTALIRKIANLRAIRPELPTHPGGQRCATLDSEPCKTIIHWWELEFGGSKLSGER